MIQTSSPTKLAEFARETGQSTQLGEFTGKDFPGGSPGERKYFFLKANSLIQRLFITI